MKILISLLLLCCSYSAQSQSGLYFINKNRITTSYHEGDNIRFRLKDETHFMEQMIIGFSGDIIKFHYFDLDVSEIAEIDLTGKQTNGLDVISAVGVRAGILFLIIDVFNQGVIRDEGFEPSEISLFIGGTLLASSGMAKLLSKKKFDLTKTKYRLETF